MFQAKDIVGIEVTEQEVAEYVKYLFKCGSSRVTQAVKITPKVRKLYKCYLFL